LNSIYEKEKEEKKEKKQLGSIVSAHYVNQALWVEWPNPKKNGVKSKTDRHK
jgi:hypothetical protein